MDTMDTSRPKERGRGETKPDFDLYGRKYCGHIYWRAERNWEKRFLKSITYQSRLQDGTDRLTVLFLSLNVYSYMHANERLLLLMPSSCPAHRFQVLYQSLEIGFLVSSILAALFIAHLANNLTYVLGEKSACNK